MYTVEKTSTATVIIAGASLILLQSKSEKYKKHGCQTSNNIVLGKHLENAVVPVYRAGLSWSFQQVCLSYNRSIPLVL